MSYIQNGSAGGGGGTVTAVTASAPLASSGGNTPDISGPTLVTSAAALTANRLVIGGGLQASAVLGSLGTTTTLLHGNAAGAPTFATVTGSDFTNQGTTTTVLHGNAAGAASFGAVVNADITSLDASTKLTGVVPLANGGRTLLNMQYATNTLTGDSTDQVIFTYTLPANTIAAGEGIRIIARHNQTGTTSTTYKINFGATTVLSTASTAAGNNHHFVEIYNQPGLTNAQVTMGKFATLSAFVSGTYTDSAIDTTAGVTVTLTYNVANTVTIVGTRAWSVEIIH